MIITVKTKKIAVVSAIVIVVILAVFALIESATAPLDDSRNLFQINTANQIKKSDSESIAHLLEPVEKETIIIFGGDIMLSRQVNSRMEKYDDYTWPFAEIATTTREADIAVANLESPFLKNSSYTVLTGSFYFKANPLSASGLNQAGIDVLSLANNHMLNQGERGIKDTISVLSDNNIYYCGAGLSEDEARRAAIVEKNGLKFAFLSYAYPDDASVASGNQSGIAGMDIEKMKSNVTSVKGQVDAIIILMHAGNEYTTTPNKQQKEFAHAAIEAGADLVVGHHPHWPQTYEFYQDKPIIYSLGNFVFDQMWSEETKQGLLLKLTWQKGIKELRFIPIKIHDYGQARIIDEGEERNRLLKKIGAPENGIIFTKNEK